MGTAYQRADTGNNISNGNIINADDLDGEFNAIEAAFSTTGHTHDGTTGEGGPISVVGPTLDVTIGATAVLPRLDNTVDLGSTTLEFKDLWIDGTANIDSLVADTADINGGTIDGTVIGATTPAAATVAALGATTGTFSSNVSAGGTLTVTGNTTLNGNTTIGNANTDTVTVTADVASNLIPSADNTYDLGSTTDEWKDLWIDGVANIDSLVADTADINAGTVDAVVGGTTPAAGTFTALTANTSFTVSNTGPFIILNDTNGNSGNAQITLGMTGSSFAIASRDSAGTPLAYNDYLMGRSTAGATTHQFNVLGTTKLEVDTNGIEVAGTIYATGNVTIDRDGANVGVQQDTGTGNVGFSLLNSSGIVRGDFGWDGTNSEALIRTYSALGVLHHTYNMTDAVFNVDTSHATNSGFNINLTGTRRLTMATNEIAGYAADGSTLFLNLPLTASGGALGSIAAYDQTNAGSANLVVTSDGAIRRSTSSGQFKVNRQEILNTGEVIDVLNPVTFESTIPGSEGRRYAGFIAEEVFAAYPEADADGGQNYDVRALVAVLWKEVKELRQRVAALEAQ